MIDVALRTTNPLTQGIDRERLEREGFVKIGIGEEPFLPFAEGNFFTQSGKAELYSESLAAMGLDPVVRFVAPTESRHSAAAQRFPLELLARKSDNFLNSTFANLPVTQAMESPGIIEIHSADATARGISRSAIAS